MPSIAGSTACGDVYTTANVITWKTWCNGTTSFNTDVEWPNTWTNGGVTTSTCFTSNSTWVTWIEESTPIRNCGPSDDLIAARRRMAELDPVARERRQAQREAHSEALRQANERAATAALAQRQADARAEALLRQNLTLQQQLDFERTKSFVVNGFNNVRYRIRKGRVANVDVVGKDGRVQDRLCFHPGLPCPDFDVMLAQKLLLESDEAHALRVANRHGSYDNSNPVLPALLN